MGHIYKMQHPEIFQGKISNKCYFEGWYFKIVDKDAKHVFAFIIGINLNQKEGTSHCSIQFFDGTSLKASYFQYPIEQWSASEKAFEVHIGTNFFSTHQLIIDIDQNGQRIAADLRFENTIPLPKSGIGHGIMGVASYVPKLQGRHGIVSLNHTITGTVTVNNVMTDFTGGKGYTEKDWGTSFPIGYSWMQCNHFDHQNASFIASIALIPFMGMKMLAIFGVLYANDTVYWLANYKFYKLCVHALEEKYLHFTVKNRQYELEVKGYKTEGVNLPSPVKGTMKSSISESLTSKLVVRLSETVKNHKKLLFHGVGEPAGLEIQLTPKHVPIEKFVLF